MEKNYYILVANDGEGFKGEILDAMTIVKARLEFNKWELYDRTPNRSSMKPGDYCLFYLAGKTSKAQHVIGEAVVRNVARTKFQQRLYVQTEIPCGYLEFDQVKIYDKPISLRENLSKLSFIPPNKGKWGAALQSGCRKISAGDFKILRSK